MAGTWSSETSATVTTIVLTPSVPIAAGARHDVSEEADRLVRFIAPQAGKHEVRWSA